MSASINEPPIDLAARGYVEEDEAEEAFSS
jgi:hypothetical protein